MALVDSFDSIIFDYGGVLVAHQTDSDQARMANRAGVPTEQFSELYWTNRLDYDKGLLTAPEYWQDIAQQAGNFFSAEVVERLTELDTASWMRFDSVMWNWLTQLHASKIRIAILSNMPRDLGDALRTGTNRLDNFDQVTLSFEVRSAKPEPAIYEHCLEGLGTSPERTLFLDDRIENVQGAELLGIRAMQFLDRDDVLLQLRA